MRYRILTYSPDMGTDERGDYRTQQEARRALKLYRQEAGALIYDLDRWRVVYRRGYWPTGTLPIERGCNSPKGVDTINITGTRYRWEKGI